MHSNKCDKIKVAVIGLGNRGNDIYAHYQLVAPDEMQITAVADPIKKKREAAQKLYNVPAENCFSSGEELLSQPRLADAVVIATQDKQHVKQAVAAIEKGYHVICEKPISPDIEECLLLQQKAHEHSRMVAVGHVLRYTPFYSKLKEVIDSGRLGQIVTIQAMENVTYWHQAHSYVRGNWRDSHETSPMIMAKSCHDMDIFAWLLNKKCKRISSFGNLYLFKPEMAPEGAAKRCLDGCKAKDKCPYDAEKIYITNKRTGIRDVTANNRTGDDAWPVSILSPNDVTEEAIYKALKEGPYGRCVYYCDNNVVDHQVVSMEFEGHVTADFTMTAFTGAGGRTIHVCGTNGDAFGNLGNNTLTIREFGKEPEVINTAYGDMSGHAGGDNRLIHDFLSAVSRGNCEESLTTGIDVSIQSHIMAIAAELSRQNKGEMVDIDRFIKDKFYERI
jgi:predicted dehydrogenase